MSERLAYSLKIADEIEDKSEKQEVEKKLLLDKAGRLSKQESNLITLNEEADNKLEKIKIEKKILINLKAEKDNVVKYLMAKVEGSREKLNKLLNSILNLKKENNFLKKQVTTLAIHESSLLRVNEKLAYQNELRAKALKQDKLEILNIVKLVSMGRTEEVIQKYNNNEEYIL